MDQFIAWYFALGQQLIAATKDAPEIVTLGAYVLACLWLPLLLVTGLFATLKWLDHRDARHIRKAIAQRAAAQARELD